MRSIKRALVVLSTAVLSAGALVGLEASPAAAADCSVHSDGKLYCGNKNGATVWLKPWLNNPDNNPADWLYTTYSWFTCWSEGTQHAGGNTTWYYTKGDNWGNWGYVAAVDLNTSSSFDANPTAYGLRHC